MLGYNKMSKERDKFLTEAMELCWHRWVYKAKTLYCSKCKNWSSAITSNPNFSTWQSFGELWNWATKQKWWNKFEYDYIERGSGEIGAKNRLKRLINPNKFADAIYEWLKENRKYIK